MTTASDTLGGVFATAYREAGGPTPDAVIILPDKNGPPWYSTLALAFKSSSLSGLVRLALARLGVRFGTEVIDGVRLRWPDAICGSDTSRHSVPSLSEANGLSLLVSLKPDILLSIGAPVIFSSDVLKIPRVAALNVHNGRLPAYRGHFGTFWEIFHGETWAYVCVHEMATRVDSGSVVASDRVRVSEYSSLLEIMLEKKRRGGALLARALQRVVNGDPFRETDLHQQSTPGRHFPWPSLSDILSMRVPGVSRLAKTQ